MRTTVEDIERESILERLDDLTLKLLTAPLALAEGVMVAAQRALGIRRMGYIFVLPNVLIFSIFIILPMLLNFYYGFTSGSSILPQNREFVGTANLQSLLTCADYSQPLTCEQDLFWRGAGNTVRYVLFEVIAIVFLSTATALALSRKIRARAFFRSVFFYPVLLSPVVVALIWKWILQSQHGLINATLNNVGLEPVPFLLNPDWSTFWVIIISVWAQMGFYTLIVLAGLQSIPEEYYEAAVIDGADSWQRFLHITLPLLKPTMLVVIVLSIIRAVQVFDLIYVLTGGGPGTSTLFIVQYIYQTAFDDRNFGMAAGASLLLALVLFIFTLAQVRLRHSNDLD